MTASPGGSAFGNHQCRRVQLDVCLAIAGGYRFRVRHLSPKSASKQALAALVFGSSLFAILICEVIVRVGGLVPNVHAIWRDDEKSIYQRSTNPVLGHELKRSYSREFEYGVATSNSHGLRDRERSVTKPAGTRRIIMLGDSVVEGVNYVADPDTPSRRLEDVLDRTEVLNFGTSGYCTLAEVELLETRGVQFAPDDVVVMFTDNDFNNIVPEHTAGGGITQRPDWAKSMFVRSELFRLLCLKLDWFSFAEEQDPVARNREAIGENNVVTAFERLHKLANEHGFRTVIAVWPHFTDATIQDFRDDPGPLLLVERLAAMHGLPCIRLAPTFRKHYASQATSEKPSKLYNVRDDGMHPNATAAAVAATALKSYLTDPLPPAPPYVQGAPDPEAVAAAAQRGDGQTPDDMSLERRIYRSLRYQGLMEESEEYLRKLIEKNPDHLHANANLGFFTAKRGEFEKAIPYLRTALKQAPGGFDIRVVLADALSQTHDKQGALQCLADGLQLTPGNPHLHLAAGWVFLRAGEPKAARLELDRVLTITPDLPGVADLSHALNRATTNSIPGGL